MAISADWTINTTTKVIYHSAGTAVYTINELYSYLQDTFDETSYLPYLSPMSAQTPTDYTLINGWYIIENAGYNSWQYLSSGSVKTIGWDAATYTTTGIYILTFPTGTYTNCITTDIGKTVVNGADNGVLLDYDNTLKIWWVRRVTGTTWANATTTITSGTGGNATGSTSKTTGESLFSNVYSIGSLEPTTTNNLYVEQNAALIPQYWGTGHINLVLKVKQASTLIDTGFVTIFCREYSDLFSHYKIDLSGGGTNPAPLGTSDDVNNHTASGTISALTVTITAGAITRDISDGAGLQPYDIEINCGNAASLQEVYEFTKLYSSRGQTGKFYTAANTGYLEVVPAPYGTFAGGKFFGARGVWFTNIPAQDNKPTKFQVTDSNNVIRSPLASYAFSVTNVIDGTEVRIFKQSDLTELGGAENVGATPSGLSNVTVSADPDNAGRYKMAYSYVYASDISVYVVAFNEGYQALRPAAILKAADASLQIAQNLDRQYDVGTVP